MADKISTNDTYEDATFLGVLAAFNDGAWSFVKTGIRESDSLDAYDPYYLDPDATDSFDYFSFYPHNLYEVYVDLALFPRGDQYSQGMIIIENGSQKDGEIFYFIESGTLTEKSQEDFDEVVKISIETYGEDHVFVNDWPSSSYIRLDTPWDINDRAVLSVQGITVNYTYDEYGELEILQDYIETDYWLEIAPKSGFISFPDGGDLKLEFTATFGSEAGEVLVVDRGNDRLVGLEGDDWLDGGNGYNILDGGEGRDTLIGGEGHDTLDGGTGEDFLFGGPGNDTYHVDETFDLVDEGAVFPQLAGLPTDFDTIVSHANWYWDVYSVAERLVLAEDAADPVGAGTTIVGSIFSNEMIGNSQNNFLFGRGGSDIYKAGDGVDWISLSTLGLTDDNAYAGVDGSNTVIVERRESGSTSYDIVFEFESGKDKIDVSDYAEVNGLKSGADVLARGYDDGAGSSYFILGDGFDYLYMAGLTLDQIGAGDFVV